MKEKIRKFWGVVKAMWYKPLPGRFLTLKEAGAFGIYALGNSWIYNSVLLVVAVTQIPVFLGNPRRTRFRHLHSRNVDNGNIHSHYRKRNGKKAYQVGTLQAVYIVLVAGAVFGYYAGDVDSSVR